MSKETSDQMAAVAARYINITEEDWASMPLSEQLRIVHSLAGSVLAQAEKELPPPNNPQDEMP